MKQSLHMIERIKQHVYSAIEQNYHILELIDYQTEDITRILRTFNNFSRRRIKQSSWEPLKFCNGCKSWINDPTKHVKCKTVDN